MKFLIKIYSFLLIIFIVVNSSGAEMLTLNQAINIALNHNPDLKALSWSVEGQKNEANAAKGRYYPKLNIEERFLRTDNPTFGFMAKLNQERFAQNDFLINRLNNPDDISDFQTLLTVEQSLYVPKVHIGFGMAKNELKAKEAEFEIKKEEIALSVLQMFLGVQTAQEYLKSAQKSIEDALEHKRLASLKYNVGTAVYSDSLRTEVEVKKAQAFLASTKADLDVSRRALGMVLGRSEPVDVTEDRILLHLSDLDSYLEVSLNRKDIEALKIRYENAKAGVNMEKSGFLPEAGIRGSYQMNDNKNPFSPDGDSYMIMGFLKWNLFDASQYSKIKKAKADEKIFEERLSSLKNRINFRS